MSINTNSSVVKVAFGLVRNPVWCFLRVPIKLLGVNRYAIYTALSLLKLKSEFFNSKLELIEKNTDGWISNLKGLQIETNDFWLKGSISVENFMIHVLNDQPKEYDNILDGLENCLSSCGNDALSIKVIRARLNHRYKHYK